MSVASDRRTLEAISTCEHCGEKLGLCRCDRDYTPLYEEFQESLAEYIEEENYGN